MSLHACSSKKDATKSLFFSISTILLLGISSALHYFAFKTSFWATELPVFVLGALICLYGVALILQKQVFKVHMGKIDILVLLFIGYIFSHSMVIAWPHLPVDRLYFPLGIGAFYMLARLGIPSNANTLAMGLVYIAALQAVVGILQALGAIPYFHPQHRAVGLFNNPGIYAGFLSLGLCTVLERMLHKDSIKRRGLLVFPALLIGTALVLLGSRTAWVSVLSGILLLVCLRYGQVLHGTIWRHKWPILIGASSVFLGGMYFLLQMNPASVGGRMLIWKVGWQMFLERPWFGRGYGSFYTEYGNYQSAYFLSGSGSVAEMQTAAMNYHAFNEPLKMLVEEGLVGFALFVLLVAATATFALKAIHNMGPGLTTSMAIVFVTLLFGSFSYPFQDPSMSLLFALSIACIASRQSAIAPRRTAGPGKLFRIAAFGTLALFGFRCSEKIFAILVWKHAKENILVQEGDALRNYERAYSILSNNGAFLFNYGAELFDMGHYEKALDLFQKAKRYGNSVELHVKTAQVHTALREYGPAEMSYLKAAYMNPKLFVPFYELFLFYGHTGQEDKARETARMIREKPVKVPSITIDKIREYINLYLQEK